jgi:hypothetical protein
LPNEPSPPPFATNVPSTRFVTPLTGAALLSFAVNLWAQQADSARCPQLLSGPTHDSVVVRIGMTVTSMDSGSKVSANYRSLFVQAVRLLAIHGLH